MLIFGYAFLIAYYALIRALIIGINISNNNIYIYVNELRVIEN